MGWFNATNNTSFNPEPKEIVFGLFKQCLAGHEAVRKFNYTFLYMMYYIYSNKLKESSIFYLNLLIRLILNTRLRNLHDLIYFIRPL